MVKACAPVFQRETEECSTAEFKAGCQGGTGVPVPGCSTKAREVGELALSCVEAGRGAGRAWSPLRGHEHLGWGRFTVVTNTSRMLRGVSQQPTSSTPASKSVLTAGLGRRCYYPSLGEAAWYGS